MKKAFFVVDFFLVYELSATYSQDIIVTGSVLDSITNKTIPYATIRIVNLNSNNDKMQADE